MNNLKTASRPLDTAIQEVMKRMSEHYAQTGAYASEDLARVLGDPVKGIGLRETPKDVPQKKAA